MAADLLFCPTARAAISSSGNNGGSTSGFLHIIIIITLQDRTRTVCDSLHVGRHSR